MAGDGEEPRRSLESLQFDTVERVQGAPVPTCAACRTPIRDTYFEAMGHVLCPSCASAFLGSGGTATFLRAAGFGAGATLLGALIWYAIIAATKSPLDLIAIAVGFLVGHAVRRGARGRGGWRYQALAMCLTYASITASYVPFVLQGFGDAATQLPPVTFAAMVVAVAFAWPFLAGLRNVLGIVIIAIALYQAWKINRRVPVTGPFRLAQRA